MDREAEREDRFPSFRIARIRMKGFAKSAIESASWKAWESIYFRELFESFLDSPSKCAVRIDKTHL